MWCLQLLFSQAALAIQSLLCFQTHLKIVFFFYLCEICHWNFNRNHIRSINGLVDMDTLTMLINSSDPWGRDILPFASVVCRFHYQSLVVFIVQVIHWRNLFSRFFFFLLSRQKFPGQVANLCHSSNLGYSSDNAGSLPCWATRELLPKYCFCYYCIVIVVFISCS